MYAVSRIVAPLACVARGVAVRPVVARCFASKPTLLTDDERKTLLPDLNEWSMVRAVMLWHLLCWACILPCAVWR